jgi:ankyrin repeat protein
MEQTALHLAVQNGHETVAILLLEPGASMGKLLMEARGIGRNDDIYEIKMREDYAYENEWGLRGLSMLRNNQRTRNRKSQRHKQSIKIVQQESQTFLHLTTLGRHEALVSMLIKKGRERS